MKKDPGSIHNKVRLLYVGQVHAYKGVHTVIQAAHMANGMLAAREKSGPVADMSLSVVGQCSAAYQRELEGLARAGPTEITFAGKLPYDELPRIYRNHDIFIFPSIWQEPFGLTHLEAMASGLPVISTYDGGHGEVLRDGENALLFEKGNEAQLAEAILRMIRDANLRRKLTRQAHTMVETRFTLRRYVRDIEVFLEGGGKVGQAPPYR